MKNIFVSEQVQILLQRMRDYPEDFFSEETFSTRLGFEITWGTIARRGHFNLIEHFLVNRYLRKIGQEQTKQAILEKLISKTTSDYDVLGSAPTITIPSGKAILANVSTRSAISKTHK